MQKLINRHHAAQEIINFRLTHPTFPSSATTVASDPCVMTAMRLCVPDALGQAAIFSAISLTSSVYTMMKNAISTLTLL